MINGLNLLSQIAQRVLASPDTAQLAHTPGVLFLSGASTILVDGKIVGGIGVDGTPGGKLDEECAIVGANAYHL